MFNACVRVGLCPLPTKCSWFTYRVVDRVACDNVDKSHPYDT